MGAKGQGAKDQGAKDWGAKDRGAKVLSPFQQYKIDVFFQLIYFEPKKNVFVNVNMSHKGLEPTFPICRVNIPTN